MRRCLCVLLPALLLVGCRATPSVPANLPLRASVSGPLALSPDGRTLWVVNPDADSVTAVDTRTLHAGAPVPVGKAPWSVAVTATGTVVVADRGTGALTLLRGGSRRDIPVGPEPGGVAVSPSGRTAYVTLASAGEVAVVDLASGTVQRRVKVGAYPWAVAVVPGGQPGDRYATVVVSHRLARLRPGGVEGTNDGKEGWLTTFGAKSGEIVLPSYAFGYPNALEGLAAAGSTVWVAHVLDSPELPRTFNTSVSAALSTVSLSTMAAIPGRKLELNDPSFSTPVNFPRAVAVTADGARAYLALAGSDEVMGIDLATPTHPRLLGFWATGRNPRGIVLDRSGTRAYVMDYLSRAVSVLDLTDTAAHREIARIPVAPETLTPTMLRGKELFNLAKDPRMSHLGWLSCASCHYDGGADGTTWMTPDGPRQTRPLWDLAGTEPLHASATRDEVQDFEHDIRQLLGGTGLILGSVHPDLGAPNGGRSADLDALATFVDHGFAPPVAPAGDAAAIARGRGLFVASGCAACHGGPHWTSSHLPGPVGTLAPGGGLEVTSVLRTVGTFDPGLDVLGADGFDPPTLLGLFATPPYLHDGSAPTLEAVLANATHAGTTFDAKQRSDLAAFLDSIDASTPPIRP